MKYYTNGDIRRLDFGPWFSVGVSRLRGFGGLHGKGGELFFVPMRKLSLLPSLGVCLHGWHWGIGWSGSAANPTATIYVKLGLISLVLPWARDR